MPRGWLPAHVTGEERVPRLTVSAEGDFRWRGEAAVPLVFDAGRVLDRGARPGAASWGQSHQISE